MSYGRLNKLWKRRAVKRGKTKKQRKKHYELNRQADRQAIALEQGAKRPSKLTGALKADEAT